MPIGLIESLDHDARGVTRQEGKTIFVEGALPGETVEYQSFRSKPTYEIAQVTRVIKASVSRVQPRCPHFDLCGGCSMQHLDPTAQVAVKQRVLEDNLWHIGRVRPEMMLRPIHGPEWGYRYRARLSVHFVAKKGGILVGFHDGHLFPGGLFLYLDRLVLCSCSGRVIERRVNGSGAHLEERGDPVDRRIDIRGVFRHDGARWGERGSCACSNLL